MAIRAGVTLGLFASLDRSPSTSELLSQELRVHPQKLRVLLDLLVEIGVLAQDDGRIFSLSNKGVVLANNNLFSDIFNLDNAIGQYEFAITSLIDVLRKDESYFIRRFGKDYWQFVSSTPSDLELVAKYSSSAAAFDADQLVLSSLWTTVSSVVDLGGGNGSMISEIVLANPHISAAVLDLSGRAEAARHSIVERGIESKVDVLEVDFFDHIPRGFECYLLNAILADWSDEDCLAILHNVRDASTPSSKLVISEVDPGAEVGTASTALKMICAAGGWLRSPHEVYDLARSAGFTLIDSAMSSLRFTQVYRLT